VVPHPNRLSGRVHTAPDHAAGRPESSAAVAAETNQLVAERGKGANALDMKVG
jgi:hypothetical protein